MIDIINRLECIEAITTIKTGLQSSETGTQYAREKQSNNQIFQILIALKTHKL